MHNKKHTWALLAFIISLIPFISTEVLADGGLDGTKDIVCSIQNVMACDLIETSDKKIEEIASMIGYNDPSSFSRAFRKFAHMSPREYRRKVAY